MNIRQEIKQGKKLISFFAIKGAGSVCSVLLHLLLAKILKPDMLGSFFLFKMVVYFSVTFFIAPFIFPFNVESNKEYSKSQKANKTFTSFLIYTFNTTILFFIVFMFFGKSIIEFTGLDYKEYRDIFILSYLGLGSSRIMRIFFLSQNKKNIHALMEFGYPLVNIIYVAAIYALNLFTLRNILLGYFISGAITTFASLFFIDYSRLWPLDFSKSNFKEIGKFGGWVSLGFIAEYLINWGDNLILRHYVSINNIGVYNFAYQAFKMGLLFNTFIGHYYIPFLSQKITNKKDIMNYLSVKNKKMYKYIIIAFLVAEIAVGPTVKTLFGSSYYGSISITRTLLVGNLFMSFSAFYIPIFAVVKEYKLLNLALITQLLINILLNIVLIPILGISGSALATTTAYIFYALFTKIIFETKIKSKLNLMWKKTQSFKPPSQSDKIALS